jgi:hypothetical protein
MEGSASDHPTSDYVDRGWTPKRRRLHNCADNPGVASALVGAGQLYTKVRTPALHGGLHLARHDSLPWRWERLREN